jgi:acetyl-CoA carboxylase carboxyltransferase component
VDLLVPDEPAAVAAARRYLSYFRPRTAPTPGGPAEHADQRVLRHLIPENRVRSYDVRPVIEALCDTGSVLELRAGFGVGVITALARLDGYAAGLLVNNPRHLGGAIDGDAADKATAFLRLCEAHRLPVVSLVDTPGFMVGPEAERTAIVRQHPPVQRRMTGRIRRLGWAGPCRMRLTATVTWSADSSAITPPVLLLRS